MRTILSRVVRKYSYLSMSHPETEERLLNLLKVHSQTMDGPSRKWLRKVVKASLALHNPFYLARHNLFIIREWRSIDTPTPEEVSNLMAENMLKAVKVMFPDMPEEKLEEYRKAYGEMNTPSKINEEVQNILDRKINSSVEPPDVLREMSNFVPEGPIRDSLQHAADWADKGNDQMLWACFNEAWLLSLDTDILPGSRDEVDWAFRSIHDLLTDSKQVKQEKVKDSEPALH